MNWRNPVFDRVQEDVDNALTQIKQWREEMTQGEIPQVFELKGCLNVSDLIRIEENIEYIITLVNEVLFPTYGVIRNNWSMEDIPTVEDVNRILNNIRTIRTNYYPPADAPAVPENMLTFTDINAIEKNLYELKEMLIPMFLGYRRCNAIVSGGTLMLPIISGTTWEDVEADSWENLEDKTWEIITILKRG